MASHNTFEGNESTYWVEVLGGRVLRYPISILEVQVSCLEQGPSVLVAKLLDGVCLILEILVEADFHEWY